MYPAQSVAPFALSHMPKLTHCKICACLFTRQWTWPLESGTVQAPMPKASCAAGLTAFRVH